MEQTFTAIVWREGKWFVSQCLEVDVASQGKSEVDALRNLEDAVKLYFEPPTPTIACAPMIGLDRHDLIENDTISRSSFVLRL
jgi:hypothetical protein